ncbi:MAG TPA: hypothetical protein VHT51_15020 [Micropepsaceae bacterium]|jgi:predicted protein tyrosine phosphatase|nr:hypothetical protein [Micropepsaceae bacterium]
MTSILISPYSALEETVRRHRPSHLITLMVEPYVDTPKAIRPDRHLRLEIHDIVEPAEGSVTPATVHIADMLAFARDWDRSAPFLVHCWAGISRSTAAAYILLCDLHGPGHEERIAQALRFHAPHAQPNSLMIRHADQLLARQGRMVTAVEAMGAPRPSWQGEVVELPLALDAL